MDLVLWRHCEALPGLPDEARPLTPRGIAQALAIARWLAPVLPGDLRILVSPALRAQQTAQALGRAFETTEEVGTGTDADDLVDAVGWPDAAGAVLVVGHQPTLGRVASRLLEGAARDRGIAPGGLLWLSSEPDRGATLKLARDADPA